MKLGAQLSAILATAFLVAAPSGALAESKVIQTAVSEKNTELPARDLIFEDQPLDPDRAVDLRSRGVDISKLAPAPTDVWQATSYPAVHPDTDKFPSDGSTLTYHSPMIDNPEGWYRVQVVGPDNQMYRLSLSLQTHQALARAALLRKIGYPVQPLKWMSKVTIQFADKKAKDAFVTNIGDEAGLVKPERFVTSNSDSKLQVVLQDAMLEPAAILVPTSFYMGNMSSARLDGRRTLRSLLVPFVLMDITESINAFNWEAIQIVSGNLIFTHKYADRFDETTLDDVRWMMRRIARLDRDDWKQIIAAGRYPDDIEAILLEKLVARRNSMIARMGIEDDLGGGLKELPYTTNVNVGSVKDGKVTRETYPGYALRFSYGDPTSPLRRDDITRFVKIEAITAAIKQITSTINENLQLFRMDQILQNRSEQLRGEFIEHMKKNPGKPFVQPLSTFSGPIGGPVINASRNIVTGSYFGDQSRDFKVNLVDQLTAGVRIGWVLGVDGIPNIAPGIGANLLVQRSYVHVRPILSMQAAEKQSWGNLWIPGFMKNMASVLDKPTDGRTEEETLAKLQDNMKKFIEDLKDGEIFTITDSIGVTGQASVTAPLAPLTGPMSFVANAVFGVNGNMIILRRTSFIREGGKIKIYLQNIQSQALGAYFDVNFWMNISRINYTKKWGQAQTRAYHLEEKPSNLKTGRATLLAIRAILKHNDSEILEDSFYPFELDHRTKSEITQGKFLWFRWTYIEEMHRVKIRPPKDPDKGIRDPRKFERTLFSYKFLDRSGKNYYAFLSDILDGLVQNSTFFKPGLLDGASGANPKDSFMGNSKWNVITTEAEVTPGKESNPVTISEYFWSGWDLSKRDLFRVIDQIDDRMKSLKLNKSLVDRNAFNDMNRLQLYEVRSTFIIYEKAMERLRGVITMTNGERGNWYERMIGWNEYSGTDPELLEKFLIPLMGGREVFDRQCREYKKLINAGGHNGADLPGAPQTEIFRGHGYECLLPWVKEVFRLRRAYPTDAEGRVKWTARMVKALEKNVDFGRLINFLGKDNVFFQIKISGFRTRDENGDKADYTSSTVGTFSQKDKAGIFRDFAADYEISSSELNASYLSEGY